jgi:site-specific DNA-methyltransferase (adenine-specific)
LTKKYDYKEMVLWKKIRSAKSSGGSGLMMGSFGRFGSPGSVPIVQETEYILWFKKPGMRKDLTDERRKESALTKEQFKTFGMQIWTVQPERAKKIGHPAPYPIEIPKRCILLGSFKGDVILDPFGGSGTTALACLDTDRKYICIDKEQKYCDLANQRIKDHLSQPMLIGK